MVIMEVETNSCLTPHVLTNKVGILTVLEAISLQGKRLIMQNGLGARI